MAQKYFSHDTNASGDKKILPLLQKYKAAGYGIFWMINETLAEKSEYRMSFKDDDLNGLVILSGKKPDGFRKFIEDCIAWGLYKTDGEYFWSVSLSKRMLKYETSIEQKRQAGLKSGEKRAKINEESTPVERPLNTPERPMNEIEQTKLNKIKLNKTNLDSNNQLNNYINDDAFYDGEKKANYPVDVEYIRQQFLAAYENYFSEYPPNDGQHKRMDTIVMHELIATYGLNEFISALEQSKTIKPADPLSWIENKLSEDTT